MEMNPKARQNGLVVQEMPDEVLVYDLDTNKAHCLNSSAALVWRSCDGNRSVSDIVQEFERSGLGKASEDLVWLAIDELQEKHLMENEVKPSFSGQSRRQVLKTIGLASMVAVPVIASLVTPQNALASVSCACTTNLQCGGACPATCNGGLGVCQ
ncbi:MAG: PqqD family protein [Pyrinomonadaceae bacterium]